MTTVAEICKQHDLNPKIVRAKLRRAIASGNLKIDHEKGGTWAASSAVLEFLGLKEKPAKAKKTTKTAKKAKAEAQATA